ncbi:thioesterase family protein [Atopomonas sediminilitoris]|uniref:thioesterase family protein n=1 Tax=Atopomonas sediminilitoris TaxID=2919919 RepID=UPI001F4E5D18|nr:thioesterase family protein [Atopomonas sediminilitoris]MCJ8167862.1 thioesterase family protein [Atopomonas sediminilitoris]
MARIELNYADELFSFTTQMQVRITDINAANHLANDAMISMLSEARARYLFALGVDEAPDDGIGVIVTDLATTYKAEAYARDTLAFALGMTDFNRYGADVIFKVTRPSDDQLIAVAKSGFVFFDYAQKRVSPIPERFLAHFPRAQPT